MIKILKKNLLGRLIPVLGLALIMLPAQAQENSVPVFESSSAQSGQSDAEIRAYWTAERMASAQPMPNPGFIVEPVSDSSVPAAIERMPADAYPTTIPGWNPNSGLPQPTEEDIVVINPDHPAYTPTELVAPQDFGTAPTNPLDGPYGPFQRWTLFGKYVNYPRSVLGKLYFSSGGGNYVCSGTVTNQNMVTTAGHCNYDAGDGFATNRMFCPSHNAGGINPTRGCWTATGSVTAGRWINNGDPDYDYACLIMPTAGSVISDSIGNVTGWVGVALNYRDTPTLSTGYAHAAPFNGQQPIMAMGPEWYDWDAIGGGQVSKIMGNDMTPGSSGGGWLLAWNNPVSEVADTDGNDVTDPKGSVLTPYITGVNSHKRCRTDCRTPPTATAGVFWQEMTSPPFNNTVGDTDEYKDIYDACITAGGGA